MLRYRDYRRSNQETRRVPKSTLRRRARLEQLVFAEREEIIIENEENALACEENLDVLEDAISEFSESDEYSSCSTPLVSRSSSVESLSHTDSELSEEHEDDEDDDIFRKKLHENTNLTIGKSIFLILDYAIRNTTTKKALFELLPLISNFLPTENNLPKTKYFLMKFIDSVLPNSQHIIKKHRMCEDCNQYLGDYNEKPAVTACDNCNSKKLSGIFVEYDLKMALKHAFEFRKLEPLMSKFNEESQIHDDSIRDINSGDKYREFKQENITNKYDVCMLWNTDGIPIADNGQIWLIQAQVVNIPRKDRRNYQFTCGIYYSRSKKPLMNTFLWPFVQSLVRLYNDGIDWIDPETGHIQHSKVIAPVATLDAPARASVQNIMQYNGEYGCTFCEHEGESCETGRGHNRVFPMNDDEPVLRTKDRMISQAEEAIETNVEHIKGVKGPSVTGLIPCFDIAQSFVPDYMHAILLGVSRMLFSLWFNTKSKNKPFYIKKNHRDEINSALSKIHPPDYITRIPRNLNYLKFFKAAELRECILNYFPILLREKLGKIYYDHFLQFVFATRLLLQEEIDLNDIELADCLFRIFVLKIPRLYGIEKCSFNVHQLTHIARNVVLWGPLTSWSAFPFEDANGYVKKGVHGSNKIDMEIANTLKILNAHQVLKHKLNIFRIEENLTPVSRGKPLKIDFHEDELTVLHEFCLSNNIDFDNIKIFSKIELFKEIYTSQRYKKQKKRNNFYVSLKDSSMNCIHFFFESDDKFFAVVRLLVHDHQQPKIAIPHLEIDFSEYIIPFRQTFTIRVVDVMEISKKIMRVHKYLCIPANLYEKK